VAGSRRKARIVAFQTLFEVDSVHHPPQEVLKRVAADEELAPESADFALHLVEGTLRSQSKIDRIIQEAAPTWPIEQIAIVDRNILRLAIFEVLFDNSGVPLKAAINEAVELAKLFGGDSSSKFVNGVLGAVTSQTS